MKVSDIYKQLRSIRSCAGLKFDSVLLGEFSFWEVHLGMLFHKPENKMRSVVRLSVAVSQNRYNWHSFPLGGVNFYS